MNAAHEGGLGSGSDGIDILAADDWQKIWWPALAILFVFALFLRWPVPGPDWTHIDERVFLLNPLKLWSGDLNPHFFIYPTLHIYLCSALYYIYFLFWHTEPIGQFIAYRFFVDGGDLIGIARGFNTVLSATTALVVAGIGRRLYGVVGGILAGLFFCVLPLSVRFAHLATTDSPAVLWIALALLGGVKIAQQGRTGDYVLAGVCAGLAGATKYPAAMVCAPLALACFLRTPAWRQRGLWLTAGLSIATFAAASPYALLDIGKAWEDLALMGRVHLMSEEATAEIPSELYYLRYAMRYGVGLAGIIAAALALLWPRKSREEWVIVAATGAFAALLMVAESVFMRYALPLAPLCALLWARLACMRRGWLSALVAIVLIVEPLAASLQTRRLLSGEDTREQAERWLGDHAANGAWVVNLPAQVGGNIEALYPESVFAREQRFAHSFSGGDLLAAYAGLAEREDLPPLYAFLQPNALGPAPGAVESDSTGTAYILWYRHPACPQVKESKARALLARCAWVEEFSPGDIERALYEPVDWYFAPIGDFAAVERTGPRIKLGRVKVGERGGQGDARAFFKILHGILKGKVLTAKGAWEEARIFYAEVARTPLALPKVLNAAYLYDYLYSYGLCYSKIGMVPQAITLWEQALALKGEEAELHNSIGVAYARLGRSEQAANHLATATTLDARYAEAHFNLGNVLYRQADREGALAAWKGAVAADPGFARAHFNLGNVHYEQGEWDRAIRSYRRAIDLQPRDSRIYYNLAQAFLKTAEPDSAINALLQVVEIDANDAEVHFRLGVLYRQRGNDPAARSWFAKVLALEPEHPSAVEIRAYMEGL